jgi:hypothetical protein
LSVFAFDPAIALSTRRFESSDPAWLEFVVANRRGGRMPADDCLEMWHFGPAAIFEIWETERATGKPRDSAYLRN